jgi:Helix-turn-helix domain
MPPARANKHGTTPEVAAYLRRSPGTLVNWRSQHVGPPYVTVEGGKVLYVWAEVDRWLEAQTVRPEAAAK